MTSWRPYLWKECRQNLRMALASLGVFLGIALIPPMLLWGDRWYDDDIIMMVIQLGGPILAVLAGVHATGREQGTIERFWQSRPIDLTRWLASKYIVGLAILLGVCWIPLLIWMILVKTVSPADMPLAGSARAILVYSFIFMLVYSASFVLGQCVRGTLHAAILAIASMAMVYIIPLVVAPLSWSVVAILLVLTAGVAFPMGTNLPAQQIIALPLPQDIACYHMAAHGNDMLILVSSGPESGSGRGRKYGFVKAHIGEQTSTVGEPLWFAGPGQQQNSNYGVYDLAWSAPDPSLAYVLLRRSRLQDQTVVECTWTLCTIALDTDQSDPIVHRVELDPLLGTADTLPAISLRGSHLYVHEEYPKARLLTFSVADSGMPALIHSEDLQRRLGYDAPGLYRDSSEQYMVQLAPIADANESVRLEITSQLAPSYCVPAGPQRIVASAPESGSLGMKLIVAETGPMQDDALPLRPVAQQRTRTFERFLGLSYGGRLYYSNDLVCRLTGMLGVTVYDISRPDRIKRIGHYAAGEGFGTMVLLPDHRVVIAGERLHVLDLSEKVSAASTR